MSSNETSTEMIRRTVLFTGRVQGVGFRYTTQWISRDFRVTGFVRNLPDGRVELLAEGVADQVEQFLEAIQDQMGSNIKHAHVSDAAATGEYASFGISF